MAHQEEIFVNGVMTQATVLDSSAQEVDDTVTAFPTHANRHSADGEDPITPPMIGAAASDLSNVTDENMLAKIISSGFSGGGGSNDNQLDNSYFLDPINQRGIALDTEFSDVGQYFIDRWILIDGTVMLTQNGLVLNGTIRQKRETALNTDFTASVFASSGTATAEYDDTLKYFDITSNGGTIVAAKLEVGTVSTIKRKDANGNWVLNDPPPNKALELAKCQNMQRVFAAKSLYAQFGVAVATSETAATAQLNVDNMRIVPTLTTSGKFMLYDGNGRSISAMTRNHQSTTSILAIDITATGLVVGQTYLLAAENDASARIIADANL